MSDKFIDYEKLISHIRKQCPLLKVVRFAADYDFGKKSTPQKDVPAAYIGMTGMAFSSNDQALGIFQEGDESFTVWVEVSNDGDRTGLNAQKQLPAIRTQLLKALLGFQGAPQSSSKPIEFVGLDLVVGDMNSARQVWAFDWTQPLMISNEDGWIDQGEDIDSIDVYIRGNPADQDYIDTTDRLITTIKLDD